MGPPCLAVWVVSSCSRRRSHARCARGGARGGARIEEAGYRRQGAHPGAEIELTKNANEGDEVAAGTGAAGEIVIAGLELMPVPGNGKLHGIDADIFEPDELAFPEVARAEVVRSEERRVGKEARS